MVVTGGYVPFPLQYIGPSFQFPQENGDTHRNDGYRDPQ